MVLFFFWSEIQIPPPHWLIVVSNINFKLRNLTLGSRFLGFLKNDNFYIFLDYLSFYFLLEYNPLTILWPFQVQSRVTQLLYIFFWLIVLDFFFFWSFHHSQMDRKFQRFSLYSLVSVSLFTSSTEATFVNLHWHVIITQGPWFTLGSSWYWTSCGYGQM